MKTRAFALCAAAGILAAGLTGCDDEKVYTLGMPESVPVSSIQLKVSDELPLAVGMDSAINYTVGPDDARNPNLLWRSSNELVASVSPEGVITAHQTGRTVITVTPEVGFGGANAEKTISVNVIPEVVKVSKIEFLNTESALYEGDNIQLEVKLYPVNHTYSHLFWGSSDESIATVDENGKVTGHKDGNVTIWAVTHDGQNLRQDFNLRIKKSVPAEEVTILPYEKTLYWMQPLQLEVRTVPEDATLATLEWTSEDESIIDVDKTGKVRAKNFGTTKVTATCTATGKSHSIELTVEPGFYIWDNTNDFAGYSINSNIGSFKVNNGVMECMVTDDANARVYFQGCTASTAKNMMSFDFKKFPIIGVLVDDTAKGATWVINLANIGNTVNVGKNMTKTDAANGKAMIYYDAADLAAFADESGMTPVRVFCFKVTKSPVSTFNVHSIRVFENVEAMTEFANQ